MLRSGYSNETMLRELSSRHFADAFDSTMEKQLTQAGANAALIEALRSGAYQLSPSEIAAAKAKLTARPGKELESSLQLQQVEPASQNKNATERPKAPQTTPPADTVYRLLKGDLVYCHHGSIVHFDDEAIEHKKLYLLLFSSNGSKPGRKLTAQLIEYYNRVAPQHPEFEVIFFSADRSQFGMETCMTQSNMPWPAVAYEKLTKKAGLIQEGLVREIPCLVLADASGSILSHSGTGEKDSSPEKILADLDLIFARGSDELAQTH